MSFVIVGTYGQKLGHVDGHAPGVYVMRLLEDGSLAHVEGADGNIAQLRHEVLEKDLCMKNMTYAAHFHTKAGADHVYFACEGVDTNGSVVAASFDRSTGHLKFLSQVDAGGCASCHVTLPSNGKRVFCANYLGTVCAVTRNEDGTLGERSDLIRFPLPQHKFLFEPFPRKHKARQDDTHPHMALLNRDESKLLVCDLGMDVVWQLDCTESASTSASLRITSMPTARNEIVGGCGPRHIALHPTLNVAYVLYEMASVVVAYPTTPTGEPGDIPLAYPVRTLASESGVFEGTHYGDDSRTTGAAIRVHPSGRFLYSTNRVTHKDLEGIVSCFSIDVETGIPTLEANVNTGGLVPRDMLLTVDGKRCLVANQNSDNMSSFVVNSETGVLEHVLTTKPTVCSPVSLLFIE